MTPDITRNGEFNIPIVGNSNKQKEGLRFMKKEKRKKNYTEGKMKEQQEKFRLEEKRNREFDRGIRITDIAVRILMWIFKD